MLMLKIIFSVFINSQLFMKIFIINFLLMIGFSFVANASLDTKETIKYLEGFRSYCYPDNWQISGGYGSQFLCKSGLRRLFKKHISREQANAQLDKDYILFKNQVLNALQKLNQHYGYNSSYSQNKIEALAIATYQKGYGNMLRHDIFRFALAHNLGGISDQVMMREFLKLSCVYSIDDKKYYMSYGLLARHYATAKLFLGKVKTLAEFKEAKEDHLEISKHVATISKFCKSKNNGWF